MPPERRLTFGAVAETYDAARPSYPSALVDDVLDAMPAPSEPRALEVGAGTGKATVLFAARGLSITALEPSAEMAALARRNASELAQVQVIESDFERWDPRGERFPLLFSAQAWHWVQPDLGYARAAAALVPGGLLAVFWNRPRWEECELRDALRRAYQRAAPEFGDDPGPMHPRTESAPALWRHWERSIARAEQFVQPQVRTYEWPMSYPTERYLQLLSTHSDHIMLAPDRREALLDAVAAVLDRHGGVLELSYVTQLCMVHRREESVSGR